MTDVPRGAWMNRETNVYKHQIPMPLGHNETPQNFSPCQDIESWDLTMRVELIN